MYGIIDIGSNTIRLVIYDKKVNKLERFFNKKMTAGLAGYVNKDKKLSPEGIDVLIDSLNDLKQITNKLPLESLGVFATASLSNIENTKEIIKKQRMRPVTISQGIKR